MTHKVDKKLLIGIAVSAFFLFLLFRKMDFEKLAAAFRGIDYRYLVPALILTFLSYYLRAVRWKFLLMPIKSIGLSNLFSATLIGYMANNVLPARLGEFVRSVALARKEGIDGSAVFATIVVDRLCDGFTMLLVLVIAFFTVQLPPDKQDIHDKLITGGYLMLALYLVVLAFLVLLKWRTEWTLRLMNVLLSPLPAKLSGKLIEMLKSFILGIRFTAAPSQFAGIVLSSLAIWATAIWPVDLLLRAFGIVLPLSASLFIMVLLVFAVMLPASPGSVGPYEYAGAAALSALGLNWELSASIALVFHGISFFPVIAAGLYCLWREKLTLKNLSEKNESGAPA
jgi:glycosyltransferase 2 family protein